MDLKIFGGRGRGGKNIPNATSEYLSQASSHENRTRQQLLQQFNRHLVQETEYTAVAFMDAEENSDGDVDVNPSCPSSKCDFIKFNQFEVNIVCSTGRSTNNISKFTGISNYRSKNIHKIHKYSLLHIWH